MVVQTSQHCSWFEARSLLVKHRDSKTPIVVQITE